MLSSGLGALACGLAHPHQCVVGFCFRGAVRQPHFLRATRPSARFFLRVTRAPRSLDAFEQHSAPVRSVAWSPDGKTLASGSNDRTIKLWEAASGTLLATLRGHADYVLNVMWSPDGKILASGSGSDDRTAKLWEAAAGKPLATLQGHTGAIRALAWSPDGKILASGSYDRTVKLWEGLSGRLLATLQGHTDLVYGLAWSPDGRVLASASRDKTVKLWDAVSGRLLNTLEGHTDAVWAVTWSPDGKTLASGSNDHTIKLWDVVSGKSFATLQGHTAAVWSVAWSLDGKTLASGGADRTVRLWDVAARTLLATLLGHTGTVWSVTWSPDGKTLASASSDPTVRLWDVATRTLLATLLGHATTVWSAVWSPDGKTLASVSSDRTVRLWEAPSGKPVGTLRGHTDEVLSLAWSPDGTTLASGAVDRTIRLWEAPFTPEIDLAQYLHAHWIRLAGSDVVWESNTDLLRDQSFDVVNLRGPTLLRVERSGLAGSKQLAEELRLLLRAANFAEALAIWKAAPAPPENSPLHRMLLATLSVSAADDVSARISWRGLWLTETVQSLVTAQTMQDPAVSLAMLRLSTQLALAGADDPQIAATRDSLNARLEGLVPQTWFMALAQDLLAAMKEPQVTAQQRAAALEQLRRLAGKVPDEVRELLEQTTSRLTAPKPSRTVQPEPVSKGP
ncbi:MAG: WD40 repeat domain-containing protein [Verrucomicrobia bacterium]|nr:WD40 repeat domain-containing protein [Verrucomicrobiota bacterium]